MRFNRKSSDTVQLQPITDSACFACLGSGLPSSSKPSIRSTLYSSTSPRQRSLLRIGGSCRLFSGRSLACGNSAEESHLTRDATELEFFSDIRSTPQKVLDVPRAGRVPAAAALFRKHQRMSTDYFACCLCSRHVS